MLKVYIHKALVCLCSHGITGVYACRDAAKGCGSVVLLFCEDSDFAILTLPVLQRCPVQDGARAVACWIPASMACLWPTEFSHR